jgi:peptidoglycan/LPS O-acetylase OafA/YrhL
MGAIRLLLAISVATAHLAGALFRDVDDAEKIIFNIGGGRAVFLFFVVSGFLMSYVLAEKYDYDAPAFYRARFVRIYPLWWALCLFVFITTPGIFGRPAADFAWTLILAGADWITALKTFPEPYPALLAHPLGVGWSLAVEVSFYLVAPFLLRSLTASIVAFVLSAAARGYIGHRYMPDPEWLCLAYYFAPTLLPFFLLGHFARLAWAWLPIDRRFGPVLLAASGALMMKANGYIENNWFYASTLFFAAALPPIFDLTRNNRRMNAAGDLTYPLYLTHTLTLMAVLLIGPQIRTALAAILPSAFSQFALGALGINIAFLVVAWATLALVERPLTRFAAELLQRRSRPIATSDQPAE